MRLMKRLGHILATVALFWIIAFVASACQPGAGAADGGGAQSPGVKLGIINPVQQFYPAPNRNQFASENSFLIATSVAIPSGAIGTGVTWVAAQTAFVDTGPNFWIHNNEPANSGRTLFLDYVKLISTAVGTAAVSWQYAIILDPVPRTITTNHLTAVTVKAANSAGTAVSTPTLNVQNSATASVLSASSASSWTAARGVIGGINIAGHVYAVYFGDYSGASSYVGSTDTAAAPGHSNDASGPVAIGPQQDCSIYFWAPSSSASLSPEFEIGMVAR